jgi:hypothetical protein
MNTFALLFKYIATVGLLGFVFVSSSAQPVDEAEKELTKIEKDWRTARIEGDVAYLENLYAKDFRFTGTDGSIIERNTDFALFASGKVTPTMIEYDDLKVSVYCPNVAVVTGRDNLKGTYNGVYGEGALRFTDVFIRREGQRQLVSNHSTWMQRK